VKIQKLIEIVMTADTNEIVWKFNDGLWRVDNNYTGLFKREGNRLIRQTRWKKIWRRREDNKQ